MKIQNTIIGDTVNLLSTVSIFPFLNSIMTKCITSPKKNQVERDGSLTFFLFLIKGNFI